MARFMKLGLEDGGERLGGGMVRYIDDIHALPVPPLSFLFPEVSLHHDSLVLPRSSGGALSGRADGMRNGYPRILRKRSATMAR